MGIFNFLKKKQEHKAVSGPYADASTNLIYQLLFCDEPELFKTSIKPPYTYPFNILFSANANAQELQRIIDDPAADPRIKMLAYNHLLKNGQQPQQKELLAVIIEIGLDQGLDVLAAFANGTARYINQAGNILVWETNDNTSAELISTLFSQCRTIIEQIGPWKDTRRPHPSTGNMRITFLVSDGLYIGEGPTNVLFSDPKANAALSTATKLLQYITEKAAAKHGGTADHQ